MDTRHAMGMFPVRYDELIINKMLGTGHVLARAFEA